MVLAVSTHVLGIVCWHSVCRRTLWDTIPGLGSGSRNTSQTPAHQTVQTVWYTHTRMHAHMQQIQTQIQIQLHSHTYKHLNMHARIQTFMNSSRTASPTFSTGTPRKLSFTSSMRLHSGPAQSSKWSRWVLSVNTQRCRRTRHSYDFVEVAEERVNIFVREKMFCLDSLLENLQNIAQPLYTHFPQKKEKEKKRHIKTNGMPSNKFTTSSCAQTSRIIRSCLKCALSVCINSEHKFVNYYVCATCMYEKESIGLCANSTVDELLSFKVLLSQSPRNLFVYSVSP